MYRYLYASPVDLDNLGDWVDWSARLSRTVGQNVEERHELRVIEEPLLAPGIDVEERLAALEELEMASRGIRLELWSVHRGYGVVAITLGPGIVRRERRALLRGLDKALAPRPLLAQHEGPWDLDRCTAFGYALDPADEADRVQIRWLVEALDQPLYMGERWLLQDRSEAIDPARYFIGQQICPRRVVFVAETEKAELDAWAQATSGEGLIALDPDDADLDLFARHFGASHDLETFLVQATAHNLPRVTLGRGPRGPGGPKVMVFDPPGYAPEIDELPIFFV